MGQRANLVRVAGAQVQNHYTHWGANRLVVDLLPGPDPAREYVTAHERLAVDDLLDDTWGEGVVVLDEDRRFLLLAGDELHVPGRRLAFALYGLSWPGWTVRWAYDGVHDLRTYLRQPALDRVDDVTDADPVWADELWADELEDEDGCGLLTVRAPDGRLAARALAWEGLEQLAASGPRALERVVGHTIPWVAEPTLGAHADVAGSRLTWWATDREVRPAPWPAWAGWTLDCAHDRFETQARELDGAPFTRWGTPETARAAAVSRLRAAVAAGPRRTHPLAAIADLFAGQDVTLSAAAAAPLVTPGGPADPEAWFDDLLDTWRQSGGVLQPVTPYDPAVDGTLGSGPPDATPHPRNP